MTPFMCWRSGRTPEDDGLSILANSPLAASETYAENREIMNVEWPVASGWESMIVIVRNEVTGDQTKWEVTGEMVPRYRSEKR